MRVIIIGFNFWRTLAIITRRWCNAEDNVRGTNKLVETRQLQKCYDNCPTVVGDILSKMSEQILHMILAKGREDYYSEGTTRRIDCNDLSQ